MNLEKIVILEISTWVEAIGAEHYYGHIRRDGERFDITQELTEDQAKSLNDKAGMSYNGIGYNAGDESVSFWTKESVCERAVHVITNKYPLVELILEDGDELNPANVLWAKSPESKELLTNIRSKYDEIISKCTEWRQDPWEIDKEGTDKLYDEWVLIINQYK